LGREIIFLVTIFDKISPGLTETDSEVAIIADLNSPLKEDSRLQTATVSRQVCPSTVIPAQAGI
jgi:hypothetical protein